VRAQGLDVPSCIRALIEEVDLTLSALAAEIGCLG
jgi:hypothetical protein